jgi:hypothetical protein
LITGSTVLIAAIYRSAWAFVPFFVGGVIFLLAQRRLKSSINNDVWTDTELEPLRKRSVHPAWMILFLLTIVAWIVCGIVTDLHRETDLLWGLLLPLQMMLPVQAMLRPARSGGDGGLLNLRNSSPIRSEHWGESS